MATVADRLSASNGLTFICDFSPPRAGDSRLLDQAGSLEADFISVSYNPGRSVRVTSPLAAAAIRQSAGRDVIFTVATRDMNRLAIQSLLLGAQLLGLENVVSVRGDTLSSEDRELTVPVNDYRTTELIQSIATMNEGRDFRGLKLRAPTQFCVGATIDLAHGVDREVSLTRKKVEAGAQFFLMQPVAGPQALSAFAESYATTFGGPLPAPVFAGVQLFAPDSLVFGEIPQWATDALESGVSAVEVGVKMIKGLADAGFKSVYLIPPILKGGVRDYETARQVLAEFSGGGPVNRERRS